MAIVNSEEGTFGPVLHISLVRRFHNVEDDRHSVLIVIPNNSLMRVRTISFDHSVSLDRTFGWLVIWQNHFCRIRKLLPQEIHIFLIAMRGMLQDWTYLLRVLWLLTATMFSSNSIGLWEALSDGVRGKGYWFRGSFLLLSEFSLKFFFGILESTSFS